MHLNDSLLNLFMSSLARSSSTRRRDLALAGQHVAAYEAPSGGTFVKGNFGEAPLELLP